MCAKKALRTKDSSAAIFPSRCPARGCDLDVANCDFKAAPGAAFLFRRFPLGCRYGQAAKPRHRTGAHARPARPTGLCPRRPGLHRVLQSGLSRLARPGRRRFARTAMLVPFQPGCRGRGRDCRRAVSAAGGSSRGGGRGQRLPHGLVRPGRLSRGEVHSPWGRGGGRDRSGGDCRRRRPKRAARFSADRRGRGRIAAPAGVVAALSGRSRLALRPRPPAGRQSGDAPRPGAGGVGRRQPGERAVGGSAGERPATCGHGDSLRPLARRGRPVGSAGLRLAGGGDDSLDHRGRFRRDPPDAARRRPERFC